MEAETWKRVQLGDVITLQRGFDLPASQRQTGQIPVVSSSGVAFTHSEARVKAPGVVTGRYGTIGQIYYITEDFWPLNTTLYVKDFKGNDPRFVSYLLQTIDFASYSDKSSVPGVNRNHLHLAEVYLPSLPEQHAIAAILGALDDKIELNRKISCTLEETARTLFKSWFVNFDPVRAKAEGRDTGLPPHIAGLFPARLQDSELGEVPEGWRMVTIGDLAEIVGGSTPSTKEPRYWDGGTVHWTTPKDLAALTVPVLLKTERRITEEGLRQISSGLLPVGTVLLSSRAPIGYLAVAEVPTAINQGFIALRPAEGISNLFLLFWAEAAHDDIISRANGSTFLEISKSNFRPIPVNQPDKSVMLAFDARVRPLYERIVLNECESRSLVAVRDALLPKLISGELRVRDAEQLIREQV